MVNPMVQVLAAWAGALGFSILFNLRGKKLFWVSLGGLLVWAAYDDTADHSLFFAAQLLA